MPFLLVLGLLPTAVAIRIVVIAQGLLLSEDAMALL